MSQIKLLHSGGNGIIVAAPANNPASDITFKLPQADGSASQVLQTDGNGNLRRYSLSGSTRVYADNQAGTVDYSNGKITTTGINILSTINTDDTIHFTVIPNSYDSVAYRSNLLDINTSLINVDGASDSIASGDTSAGVGYTSSSSHS